jgi:Mg2+-importing ATPase
VETTASVKRDGKRLAVLLAVVSAGRQSFGNIMEFIMMATSSNFGNVFSMAGATLFLPFLPLLPVQICSTTCSTT